MAVAQGQYAHEVAEMIERCGALAASLPGGKMAVEINMSCPNIAGKPPPAYDFEGMEEYLATVFARCIAEVPAF